MHPTSSESFLKTKVHFYIVLYINLSIVSKNMLKKMHNIDIFYCELWHNSSTYKQYKVVRLVRTSSLQGRLLNPDIHREIL